jgi:hypothetical protein
MSSNSGVSNSEQEFAIYNQCSNLPSFLSLSANKEDLAFFLATELIRLVPEGKVVVTGGRFISEDQADSNDKSLNLDNLKATHDEADMRMILHMLHCKNVSNCRTIAVHVSATDTDVFLLLLHHAYGMDIKIWMMTGTSKRPKIIPIQSVLETNLPTRRMVQNLLAFHSITGCDTTSFFYGISKIQRITSRGKTFWTLRYSKHQILSFIRCIRHLIVKFAYESLG